ncbi:MAG: MCE family protein [Rhodospirillaceae bacterium]|nr:MCE family protein [Rhodospirillales bacterium]
MAKKYSPSLIGGFVLGGIALLVGALFLFGSGDLFKEKRRWVTYFEGSVSGLTVGAPVNFRGVRVGTVTDVVLLLDPRNLTARIPVYFEIEPDRITWIGGKTEQSSEVAAKAGIRTKLGMQSVVTGQMLVELDLRPDTPANLIGIDPSVPEIPSIASEFDAFKQQITELPIQELVVSVDQTIKNLDSLISSPEMKESLRALAASLGETREFLSGLNQDARPLLRELTATAQSARQTSDQAGSSLRSVEGEFRSTLGEVRQLTSSTRTDLRATLRSADQALQQARTTLASVNGIVADDTRSRADIDNALENLAQASSALRSFADTVERNPNSILMGR